MIRDSLQTAAQISRKRTRLARVIARVHVTVQRHQRWRLVSAGIFIAVIVLAAMKPDLGIAPVAIAVFIPLFSWLVVRTARWKAHHETLTRLELFYDRQERRLRGKASGRETPEFITKQAGNFPAAHDLHYFGSHSLWSLLDETITDEGGTCLYQWMTANPPAETEQILSRQRDVQMLKRESWFFTRLILAANPSSEFRVSTTQIDSFLKRSFVQSWFTISFIGVWLFWIGFVASVVMAANGDASWVASALAVFALMNLGLVFKNGSKFASGVGLAHHLSELEPIFSRVEKRARESKRIGGLCPTTSMAGPSREAKKLSSVLGILGVETNPLLFLLVNAVLPWSSTGTHLLERRRRKIAESFPNCLRELAQLEVLGTLVLFAKYQTSTFPGLTGNHLSFKGLYHPLVDRTAVIENDFEFPADKSLGLITGSNMSGKSTFLRTVGLNQCLANMGAPVFADQFATRPQMIESCIEVSDSLRDGFSYFYSEVRRLKAVLQEVGSGRPVLYLIDEIFRGQAYSYPATLY
ncbi:MAG: DNA mismatch repair protein MutS, partial [Bdellovibrionota bacterium]